jgi:hypothetical protein
MHHVVVFEGEEVRSPGEIEKLALEQAKASGASIDGLLVLVTDEAAIAAGGSYRVDTEKKVFVPLPIRRRPPGK